MSVKIALLKSGEKVIADIKELVSDEDENKSVYGYLFVKPKKVDLNAPVFLSEDSQWCLITKDKEFVIPKDWIVTFMEPVDRLLGMYEESLND